MEIKLTNFVEKKVLDDIEPLLAGLNCRIVELRVGSSHEQKHVILVIYKENGVSLDDCSKVSRLVRPRLEMMEDLGEDFSLEVSSPGINRKIKNDREFAVFLGHGIKVMLLEGNDWIEGIIEKVSDNNLYLKQRENIMTINLKQIKKAKLSAEQEAK